MLTAEPVDLQASPDVLLTLGQDLISYGPATPIGLWLIRGRSEPLLVVPWAMPVAPMFDVFTLVVATQSDFLAKSFDPPSTENCPWPLESWRVSVLMERRLRPSV